MYGDGFTYFAGQGSCDAKYSYQDVANYWCQARRQKNAVNWIPATGSQKVNYVEGTLTSGQPKTLEVYVCSGHCKCLTQLTCETGPPATVAGYDGNGVPLFAGQGTCDAKNSYQDVANYWCQGMQQGNGLYWTPIFGTQTQKINYVVGTLTSGQPNTFAGFKCEQSCKCFADLTCEATTHAPTDAPTAAPTTPAPTKSPTHSVACQSWCEGDGRAWAAKCGFNACLACDDCADTPGQLKPGGQFCEGWCKFDKRPWTTKCTFNQACSDCTGC